MIKLLFAALFALALIAPAHAEDNDVRYPVVQAPVIKAKIAKHIASRDNVTISKGKVAKLQRGLAGAVFASLTEYIAPLQACGYHVEMVSWTDGPQEADVLIAHSMAMFPALESAGVRATFIIDGPFWAGDQVTTRSRVANFPTVGHPHIRGAINVPIAGFGPGGHVEAPHRAKPYILSMLGCGRKARR